MPSIKKSSSKKVPLQIQVVPLQEDKPRAITLLRNLLIAFPFNCSHPKFEVFRSSYRREPYRASFWEKISKQMESKGHLNENLMHSDNISRLRPGFEYGRYDPIINEMICKAVIQNVFGKWPSTYENGYYREDPKFIIFRDFIQLFFSFLLPSGKNWRDFLSDLSDDGSFFYGLFWVKIKDIDQNWVSAMNNKRNEIEKTYIEKLPRDERKRLVLGLANFHFQVQPEENEFLSQNLDVIREREDIAQIPLDYRTTGSTLYETLKEDVDEVKTNLQKMGQKIIIGMGYASIPYKERLDRTQKSQKDAPIEFGFTPNTLFCPNLGYENSMEKYEFDWIIDVVHTPETFVEEMNKILSLFFGQGDFQLSADGMLRYLGGSEESRQIRGMIQAFVNKKLEKVVPLVDKVLEAMERRQWNEVARDSRTLLEDFIRALLVNKKIPYDPKFTLDPLIQLLRDNLKTIFRFPKWLTSDPVDDFDHLLQGMKTMGKLTNPPSHTAKHQLMESEAILIRNSVFMFMITLAGFL